MKKFGMLIVVLIFAGTQMVIAQQQTPPPQQQQQKPAPVREYIQKNVVPVVKQEQGKFIAVLTSSEKQELTKIQKEFKDLRSGNMGPGTGMMQNHRAEVQNLLDQVKKITDAHPKASTAYKNAIEAMKTKWTTNIKSIRDKNTMGYGRAMNRNNRGPAFAIDRLSDPAFGLLFDAHNFAMMPRMGYGNYGPGRMNKQPMGKGMMCDYGRMNRNSRYHRMGMMNREFGHQRGYGKFGMQERYQMHARPGMMRAMNPEVKKEMLAYAQKNIFPVLNKERTAFDKVLKSSEKRDIKNTRKNIADIKAEMKKYREERAKVPGQKMNDSTRMAMRLNLEKNMIVVREIALRHYGQLHATLDNLKQYLPKWKKGISQIIFKQMRNKDFGRPMGAAHVRMIPPKGRMMSFHGKHRMMSDVRFLLYDPAHPDEHFFPLCNGMPANENLK